MSLFNDSFLTDSDSSNFLNDKTRIISIEGNIGSGKSTLLARLKETYGDNSSIIFLKEPVDTWEDIKDASGRTMLEKYYADQENYAFSFQLMAFISRLSLLKETIKQNPNSIIISERSLYTDARVFFKMLYESNKIEEVNKQIYDKWFESFRDDFLLEKIIYVKTEPTVCHKRVKNRARTGEDIIPLEYLIKCHEYHENMFKNENCCQDKMLILDGNRDIFLEKPALNDMLQQVKKYIGI